MPITELPRYAKARSLYGDRCHIRVREVSMIVEEVICGRCGGQMAVHAERMSMPSPIKPSGDPCAVSPPPEIEHQCQGCGCRATLSERYPRQVEVDRREAQSE